MTSASASLGGDHVTWTARPLEDRARVGVCSPGRHAAGALARSGPTSGGAGTRVTTYYRQEIS